MTDRQRTRVIVVGGGFSGISAAVALRALGHHVRILEQHATLGGRARTERYAEEHVDVGAQLIASTFTRTMRLLEHAALEPTRARDVFVRGDERHPIQFGSIASLLRFPGLRAVDKIRLGATILPKLARHGSDLRADASTELATLDGEDARSFVTDAVSDDAANILVEPPLNAFYGVRGRETSLAFYLTLGRYGSSSDLMASRGGWSSALDRAVAGIEIERGVRVVRIEHERHSFVLHDTAGDVHECDALVLATSAGVARALLHGVLDETHPLLDWMGSVVARATWTVALALSRALPPNAFGILADPRDAGSVSACAIPAGRWSDGSSPIVLAWPTPDAIDRLEGQSASDIVAAMMPEIERLVPEVRGSVAHARVYRFDEGTPLATPGFLAHRERGRELAGSLPLPVALAGDYLTMPFIEGAVASGERAAEQLVRRLTSAAAID